MSAARRSLLTATAAGTLLGALWFVPSANATGEASLTAAQKSPATTSAANVSDATVSDAGNGGAGDAGAGDDGARLADTGSFDTTPYVVGGTTFLCLGAGFVAYSVRRARTVAY
ncbi:hypothetical protein ACFVT5_02530 [Streptomyces sp. NPDC058001]|uniref:hypothetical protein n=1 Tax=Streptomyces sp. NPDC058001 TaxID=3346300 RepID=UPI0036E4E177